MIALLDRAAAAAIDADAVARLGLPSAVLMENAGRGALDAMRERFGSALERVVIVAGPGQNGGDGLVIARHLLCSGHVPRVVLLAEGASLRGDAAIQHAALSRLGGAIDELPDEDLRALDAALQSASLVVDAVFGTGLAREVRGRYARALERIGACSAPVVALDLPSGVDADTGAVLGVAVRAALTVTFAGHKLGLHQYPGAGLAGEIVLASIGVPLPARAPSSLIEASDVARWVPPRAIDAHKGSAGHVLIAAGSPGHTGAALLSGLGALRGGAGLVTLLARAEARTALDAKVVELMTAELPDDAHAAVAHVRELAENARALVVGPGLGLDAGGRALARGLALELELPAVLDADALTAFAAEPELLRSAAAPRVLTPHPGEAARLLGTSAAEIQRTRYASARALAERTGCVVLLKGARTVIAAPDGELRVCPTGTPAMAVAGSGDVLSGVVGALLAGGAAAMDAASAGAYLHGRAGELSSRGDRGLLVSELAAAVPTALAECVR